MIARSEMQEFNYPGPEGPEYTSYEGNGGVLLGSVLPPGALRLEVRRPQHPDHRRGGAGEPDPVPRTCRERVATIAPFLTQDREAYAVVADGRVYWIQDAYTVTHRYPYATRWDGRVQLHPQQRQGRGGRVRRDRGLLRLEPDDPLIRTYRRSSRDLFKPQRGDARAPREHVRVPLDLFTVQTQMLLQYHMRDPVVFYNKEDQWDVPVQTSFGRSSPCGPTTSWPDCPAKRRRSSC